MYTVDPQRMMIAVSKALETSHKQFKDRKIGLVALFSRSHRPFWGRWGKKDYYLTIELDTPPAKVIQGEPYVNYKDDPRYNVVISALWAFHNYEAGGVILDEEHKFSVLADIIINSLDNYESG